MKRSRKSTWNDYFIGGYTYDVANDQRSAGGVHIHQVRKTKDGWEKRIVQSNGRFRSIGKTEKLNEEDGLCKFKEVKHD